MRQIVIIMGSESDRPHADRILAALQGYEATVSVHVASAHKQPLEVLRIIESYATAHALVYITIAGRSNALSGFTAATPPSLCWLAHPSPTAPTCGVTSIPPCRCKQCTSAHCAGTAIAALAACVF